MARRVLVVQPERKHLLALSTLFENRGEVVISADSLKDAGNAVKRYNPDVILLDIQLLGENWSSAVPDMRAAAPRSKLLLTGNGSRERRSSKKKELEEWGVISPPFSEAKIQRALAHVGNGGSPSQPAARAGSTTGLRIPVRYKITLPYIGLALALALAGAYVVTNVVLDTIEERFANQLIETGRLTAEWMVREEDRLLESLRLIAHTEGVAEAAASGDAEALREIALPAAVNAGVEALEILDPTGVSVLSLRKRTNGRLEDYVASRGDDVFRDWSFVTQVMNLESDELGDKYAGVAAAPWGDYFYVSGPIYSADEELQGIVLIGETLESTATGIREATLAQAAIYDFDGNMMAGTYLDAPPALGQEYVRGILDRQRADSLLRELTVVDINYSEILTTLEARGGSDVAIVGTALPQTFLVQPGQTTRLQIFALASAAFALVIASGLYIAHRITRPLMEVVEASSQVARGDLTVKLPTVSNDELGTLTTAFNDMVVALERSNRELLEAYDSTLEGWSKALELRDEETEGHTARVTDLTVRLARRLGFSGDDLMHIKRGALLHDIGKVGIPDEILNKPGPLSEQEWEVMRKHPVYGYQMLSSIAYLKPALAIPSCHHERWDGSGYPLGWEGTDIPMAARIFMVVDVWDALRSDRPYRAAWPEHKVVEHLESQSGVLFDPDVVREFLQMLRTEGIDGAMPMHTPAMHRTLLRKTVPLP